MDAGINLVGHQMCGECEAFLGKEHRRSCSKIGTVTTSETVEKFTTVEHAAVEEPLLSLSPDQIECLLCFVSPAAERYSPEDAKQLLVGLRKFVEQSKETEESS